MLIDVVFFIALVLLIIFEALFTFVPLGNERSTVRRLPWITFAIMGVNVIIFYVTLPSTVQQDRELIQTKVALVEFLEENRALLADDDVRRRLEETSVLSKEEVEEIERDMRRSLEAEAQYKAWLRGAEAVQLRQQFEGKFSEFKAALEGHIYFKYGIAPNGTWKVHQLITAMFMHGDTMHLFGNLIFFFAVGFSLEDLWGRGTFLAFYLLGGIAASLPWVVSPGNVPLIGASGAISATMGAFLIRLPKTKIKIGWITFPLALFFKLFGRKPYGVINVPAYIFLPFYFIIQVIPWYVFKKAGLVSGVAYSAHIMGFLFGAAFAFMMKASKYEENYINPKIEAKVTFSASPIVNQSLEMLDRGEVVMAEHKLKSYVAKNPGDVNGLMALIQVYQQTSNYDQLNVVYGRLIRYYLANNDKEAALYAYDNLLSSFPDNGINVQIPVRDWLAICEYLREAEMNREAGVEYERLVNTYPDDPLSLRASVQGGEAALAAHDNERAMRLFQKAGSMNAPGVYLSRIEAGIEKCKVRLNNRPHWVKQPPKPRSVPNDV